jgi:hypothetical protein
VFVCMCVCMYVYIHISHVNKDLAWIRACVNIATIY